MIRSMTGYGDAEREAPAGLLRLEVKTVNHRFFNTSIKTPSGFDRFETDIAAALKRHISRGHVSASLSVGRSSTGSGTEVRLDLERAREYQNALSTLQAELDLGGLVDLSMMSRFSELFRAPEPDRTAGIDSELIKDLADEAARRAKDLREAEGERLDQDLRERLDAIGRHLDLVQARAPERLVSERDRLRAAIQELSEQVEVDEDRLSREIAYLSERWDINEEIVRFRSHIELFSEALAADGSEPVGKRLGFLVQEMHREANTVGSKANDVQISHASVSIKEEVERLREQVENVE
jgi:uncharacterized protein (TIGR00255 family)